MDPVAEWLKYAPKAPVLPEGKIWHVFLSYRSKHRQLVMQLYDILRQLGYKVFLDRLVLRPTDNLAPALEHALATSTSGILVWSSRTEDAEWFRREFQIMERKQVDGDFHFCLVKFDDSALPVFATTKSWIDLSESGGSLLGGDLLRLLYGIINKPLSEDAARFGMLFDQEGRNANYAIQAALAVGSHVRLLELAASTSVAWKSTPALRCRVAESLIKLGRNDDALAVISTVEKEFPNDLRPRQLKGLALARSRRTEEAQLALAELEAAGAYDTDTLSLYADTWMDRYRATGETRFLRKSRNLYQLVYERSVAADQPPGAVDFYAGINAAAKSVMLDELDLAREIIERIRSVRDIAHSSGDYRTKVTIAKLYMIEQQYDIAAKYYQDAIDSDPFEYGSHQSAFDEAKLIMYHLRTPEEGRKKVDSVFSYISSRCIFISYAHKDKEFFGELLVFISPLKRRANLTIWSDQSITVGQEWEPEISRNMQSANIILLLVSPDFLASEFIYEKELKFAMQRHEAGQSRVIPIFLRPCDWKTEVFGKLQGVPDDAKPISQWTDRDQAFTIVVQAIGKAVEAVHS